MFKIAILIWLVVFPFTHALKSWQVIPPTPHLPASINGGIIPLNGAKIWYAEYGKGLPLILLHGGLTNSNYFGNLVAVLATKYRVIVMDNRGHGRSSIDDQPLSYHLLAKDVLGLMAALHIQKAVIIGWSDGANIGIDIAIHHPEKLLRLFAFAGNSNPDATLNIPQTPISAAFAKRIEKEYMELSPTPSLKKYNSLTKRVEKMWQSQPNFTTQDLKNIKVPVWIVIGDHDEAVKRSDAEYMARTIPHSKLLIETDAGHFAFLQNPRQFNRDVLAFLTNTTSRGLSNTTSRGLSAGSMDAVAKPRHVEEGVVIPAQAGIHQNSSIVPH